MASPLVALRRRYKALLCALVGGAGAFLLMANAGQVRHGALLGGLSMALCVGGLLSALRLIDRDDPTDAIPITNTWLGPLAGHARITAPMFSLPLALAISIAAAALIGGEALPVAIVASLVVLLPSIPGRPGMLLFVVCASLYLPVLGVFGLWDPWETHYGEVAREILARDDWISLWWAQDRWFWSKPIYIFWSEALMWSASGVPFRADTNFEHVEWVLRLPIATVAIAAVLALYRVVSRSFGPRAGVLCGLVLATTPYFIFLSHQAITDMPFVGYMTIAVCLLMLALGEDPDRMAPRYRVGRFVVSARHAVLGAFLMLSLPQALYLITRNVTFDGGLFAWHPDEIMFGSPGNADLPGNFPLRHISPDINSLFAQPVAQGIYWLIGIAAVTFLVRKEQRTQALYMFAFYIACALAFMAKGIPGFALPGLFALLYLLCFNRWDLLLSGRLRIAAGTLTLLCVGAPWFVAMYMRHSKRFVDRLLIHDHINRLTKGVHGDKSDIQYFIEQLGYGTFPWIALAPAALGSFLLLRPAATESATGSDRAQHRRELLTVMGLWFAAAFTLFSAMTTKFHHYIFPAVPAAAVLIGLLLDRLFGPAEPPAGKQPHARYLPLAACLLAPLPLLAGVGGLFGDLRGVLPEGVSAARRAVWVFQHGPPTALCVLLVLVGLGLLAYAFVEYRRRSEAEGGDNPSGSIGGLTRAGVVGAMLSAAVLLAAIGRDLSWTTAERPAGNERLVRLFIYKYERDYPDYLDYRAAFTGFAIVGTALLLLAAVRALRPIAARALLGFGLCFALFTLDVYMIDLSPHWSQRDLVKRYYRERDGPEQPLVAWQMNWKGENLYSGNRIAVFVDLKNKEVKQWIEDNEGKTAYFLLEHGRLRRFERLVAPREVNELTTKRDNNKFVLVRVAL